MSRTLSVTVRGESYDVEIDRDYGYESDTNAWDVDWHFCMTEEELEALALTNEEEENVMMQIYELLSSTY